LELIGYFEQMKGRRHEYLGFGLWLMEEYRDCEEDGR
jgi:hypothetical protein